MGNHNRLFSHQMRLCTLIIAGQHSSLSLSFHIYCITHMHTHAHTHTHTHTRRLDVCQRSFTDTRIRNALKRYGRGKQMYPQDLSGACTVVSHVYKDSVTTAGVGDWYDCLYDTHITHHTSHASCTSRITHYTHHTSPIKHKHIIRRTAHITHTHRTSRIRHYTSDIIHHTTDSTHHTRWHTQGHTHTHTHTHTYIP